MSDKTKAAIPGRQCGCACQRGKITRLAAGGQIQPFGSMPRCFNSARPNSFNQLPRLTPSFWASFSNCSLSSGGIRIWKAGALPVPFGCRSRLTIVDMCVPIRVMFFGIGTHLNMVLSKKTTPRTAGTVPGRLTSNDR